MGLGAVVMTKDQEKADRLAAALRANLKRRKAQARAAEAPGAAPPTPASVADEAPADSDYDPGGLIGDR